jgi:hypothetical protein
VKRSYSFSIKGTSINSTVGRAFIVHFTAFCIAIG